MISENLGLGEASRQQTRSRAPRLRVLAQALCARRSFASASSFVSTYIPARPP